jgi:hypothetical protein
MELVHSRALLVGRCLPYYQSTRNEAVYRSPQENGLVYLAVSYREKQALVKGPVVGKWKVSVMQQLIIKLSELILYTKTRPVLHAIGILHAVVPGTYTFAFSEMLG